VPHGHERWSADALVFDPDERGPSVDLTRQFEAVLHLPSEDQQVIKAMLDRVIVKLRSKQFVGGLRS
jgi:hypothetical protein